MSAPRVRAAEDGHRNTQAARLRALLQDGEWHTSNELARQIGHRFGASVLVLREGSDGGLRWHIQKQRMNSAGSKWRYRFTGVNPGPYVKQLPTTPPRGFWETFRLLVTHAPSARRAAREILEAQP